MGLARINAVFRLARRGVQERQVENLRDSSC